MNLQRLSRIPPKFKLNPRLLTLASTARRAPKMIGNPDVIVSGHELCLRGPEDSSTLKTCREHFNSHNGATFLKNSKNKSGLCQAELELEVEPELRVTPEMPDWDFELKAKLLIVEGNIGVGKTTLTKKLADKLNYRIFLEPTTENPYLEKFYADPHKFALKLQLWILYQRYMTYVQAVRHILKTGQGVILDRSIFSDCVFARVCTREGFISNEGYDQYQYWRERCLEHLPLPHVTIFLDASPQCCYDRIHRRARDCESGVSLDYLEKLHEEYLQFIDSMRTQGCHVLKYDWSIFKEEKMVCDAVECAHTAKWTYAKLPTEDRIIREFDLSKATP